MITVGTEKIGIKLESITKGINYLVYALNFPKN